jgi:hypothetical protein
MTFYIVVHIIIGYIIGSVSTIYSDLHSGRVDPGSFPEWTYGPLLNLFVKISLMAGILAVVTTFINFDFQYALMTLGELLVGVFITRLTPIKFRYFAVVTSPISLLIIFGALWGFWYLG